MNGHSNKEKDIECLTEAHIRELPDNSPVAEERQECSRTDIRKEAGRLEMQFHITGLTGFLESAKPDDLTEFGVQLKIFAHSLIEHARTLRREE